MSDTSTEEPGVEPPNNRMQDLELPADAPGWARVVLSAMNDKINHLMDSHDMLYELVTSATTKVVNTENNIDTINKEMTELRMENAKLKVENVRMKEQLLKLATFCRNDCRVCEEKVEEAKDETSTDCTRKVLSALKECCRMGTRRPQVSVFSWGKSTSNPPFTRIKATVLLIFHASKITLFLDFLKIQEFPIL